MAASATTVNRYFADLSSRLTAVAGTDGDGNPMSLTEATMAAMALVSEVRDRGGKVMFIGNGGSAAIASHFALDFWHAGGVPTMDCNAAPQLTCLANDYGYEEVFSRTIDFYAKPTDLLVAISSSGKSPNILAGVGAARRIGCAVISLSGFAEDCPLRRMGDVNLYVPASHFGLVETIHTALIHAILSLLVGYDPR